MDKTMRRSLYYVKLINEMSTRKGNQSSSQYFDEEGRHRTLEVNLDD